MGDSWIRALTLFGIAMIWLDVGYLMPTYVPVTSEGSLAFGRSFWHATDTPFFAKWIVSGLKFVLGIPFIIIGILMWDFNFGASAFGTAAASSLVFYTLLIPYVVILSFFIENEDGVPPGYRLFQFFIARSGAKELDRTLGQHGADLNTSAFADATSSDRSDKYQSRMEAEELRDAAERLRKDAEAARMRSQELYEAEEARISAAEDAARAAEEAYRAKARERAHRKRGRDE